MNVDSRGASRRRFPGWLRWAGAGVGFGLVLAVVFVFVQRSTSERVQEIVQAEAEMFAAAESVEDLPLEAIASGVMEAMGGADRLNEIAGVRKIGQSETNDGTVDVDYYYREPVMSRYRLSGEGGSYIVGFDGTIAWAQIVANSGQSMWRELSAEEATHLRRNAEMVRPVSYFFEQIQYFDKLADTVVGESPCYVLEFDGPLQARQVFFIEKQTFRILKRERVDRFGEESGFRLEVYYRDFREVEGVQFAFEEEVLINGERDNVFLLEKVELNPGVLSSFFSPPDLPQAAAVP